ncbi:uncharacterized protein LOC134202822 [Armigeres subalbatus]|uniref:uncharacterized protein LOC134202822 n=1 Tax=Armigeres subalbatus TaxID=124917 RepID=UPI002ED34756
MNELITQNNQQVHINSRINTRISELTSSINKIINSMKTNELANEISAIITIINIDIINKLLEDIQDAIILSKTATIANRVLSIQEISFIKSLLQNQGVNIDVPDEALQHVTPKFAATQHTLLYILHVPQLDNVTSSVIRIHPIVHKNQIIYDYPEYVVKSENSLYTTSEPFEFVQKAKYLKEMHDTCIYPLVFGKQSICNSTFYNRTSQLLVTENTLLVQNAKNHTLSSNCGPDDRTLEGNFLISFGNCSITFNNHSFQNNEIIQEATVIYGALHNIKTSWNYHQHLDIFTLSNETLETRDKLQHVYLEQYSLKLKFWTLTGGLSSIYIIISIIIFIIAKTRCRVQLKGPRRSSLGEGEVIEHPSNHDNPSTELLRNKLQIIQQQQQQIALALGTVNALPSAADTNSNISNNTCAP